jgi:acyl carrier protein
MGLDSVELLMEFEEYFSISIPGQEASSLATIQLVVDCVGRYLNVEWDDKRIQLQVFSELSRIFQDTGNELEELRLTSYISCYFDPNDQVQTKLLEQQLNLNVKGICSNAPQSGSFLAKVKNMFVWRSSYDWNIVSVAGFVDAICAHNLDKFVDRGNISSKYEIYLAVMKMTVDKVGVGYLDISPDKSFTSDLGID